MFNSLPVRNLHLNSELDFSDDSFQTLDILRAFVARLDKQRFWTFLRVHKPTICAIQKC